MINPEEKAKELFNKYYDWCDSQFTESATLNTAKECCLICIDEIIQALKDNHDYSKCDVEFTYWEKIRKIINELP